ncbi:C4-dicarboxylate ABC transporter permease [Vulcanisaeta thermophila]|uniref:C4-dicarboxylate ABC transporter permease n=1 Tax=Vulcanisaeta thermophila TaxID=867917 RepID=UPI0008536084|nr:C4-dicarboxylate ABC transporter permease [Vulcanisaeta thermophila]
MAFPKLLTISMALTLLTYFILLSSLAGTYLIVRGFIMGITVLILTFISFFTSFIAVKQSWYDLNTAYADREIIIGRVKRIVAFFSLALNILNIILAFTYVLAVLI